MIKNTISIDNGLPFQIDKPSSNVYTPTNQKYLSPNSVAGPGTTTTIIMTSSRGNEGLTISTAGTVGTTGNVGTIGTVGTLSKDSKLLANEKNDKNKRDILAKLAAINKKATCKICTTICNKKNLCRILNLGLYHKYTSSQDYFYTKDINIIMKKKRKNAYISYKDYLVYDDNTKEYFKEYYNMNESIMIIKEIKEFYTKFKCYARNFQMPFYKILSINIKNHRKLEYVKVFKVYDIEQSSDKRSVNQNQQQDNESNINQKYSFNILEELGNSFFNQYNNNNQNQISINFEKAKAINNGWYNQYKQEDFKKKNDHIKKVNNYMNNDSFNIEVGLNFKILKKIGENEKEFMSTPRLNESIKKLQLDLFCRQDSEAAADELNDLMKNMNIKKSKKIHEVREESYQEIIKKYIDSNKNALQASKRHLAKNRLKINPNLINLANNNNNNNNNNAKSDDNKERDIIDHTSSNTNDESPIYILSSPYTKDIDFDKYINKNNTLSPNLAIKKSMQKIMPGCNSRYPVSEQTEKVIGGDLMRHHKQLSYPNKLQDYQLTDFSKEKHINQFEKPIILGQQLQQQQQNIGGTGFNMKSPRLNFSIAKLLKQRSGNSAERISNKNGAVSMNTKKKNTMHRATSSLFTQTSNTLNIMNYQNEFLNPNQENESILKKHELSRSRDAVSMNKTIKDYMAETLTLNINNTNQKTSLKNKPLDKTPINLSKYVKNGIINKVDHKLSSKMNLLIKNFSSKELSLPIQRNSGSPHRLSNNMMTTSLKQQQQQQQQPIFNNHTETVRNTISKKILAQRKNIMKINSLESEYNNSKSKNIYISSPMNNNNNNNNNHIGVAGGAINEMLAMRKIKHDRSKLSMDNTSSLEYSVHKFPLTTNENNKKMIFKNIYAAKQPNKNTSLSPSKNKTHYLHVFKNQVLFHYQ